MQTQATSNILMIRPVQFQFNEETAESNTFQDPAVAELPESKTQAKALAEFDEMVDRLRLAGVNVIVFNDNSTHYTPDSIFPNNWVSFHASGKVVLYPMEAENRRMERRKDIIDELQKTYNVEVIYDFSHFESENEFLEGTGSLVLDRMYRKAYACISSRTSEVVLKAWKKQVQTYDVISFRAFGRDGLPIYHTNVMMCVGNTFAVVCLESVKDYDERFALKQHLEEDGKNIIEISMEQMASFAGNMLLVKKQNEGHLLVMSDTAYYSLTDSQLLELEEYAELIHFDLSMIEACGGGSARCMMAEVHLPLK